MKIGRREFVATTVGAGAYALFASAETVIEGSKMYGLVGSMIAVEGKRDELIKILLEGVSGMPGCLSYVVAKDPKDPHGIWITEVWDSKESHAASLKLPSVQAAIAKGKPLIAKFGSYNETEPVGGHGLQKPAR
ncbi:MAG: putative quinol monooxygenase [Pyrinomonadaceae bacterium]